MLYLGSFLVEFVSVFLEKFIFQGFGIDSIFGFDDYRLENDCEIKSWLVASISMVPSDLESGYNHHKKVDVQMPVKFGLEVWFPIGRKWKLGSGIGYTYLTMKKLDTYEYVELDDNNGQEYWEKTEVTAHYIGIPLEVSRILWNKKRWSFYAVAGGAIEFNLKSHSRKDYYLNYYNLSDSRDERPQFSALARLGVQYGVADRLAFFFEPGVSYYFYNGADSNIYSERPLRFHINMGLRIILGNQITKTE